MTDDRTTRRLAVLIDADNASARIAPGLFEEIATIGVANLRRIYGDFSGTRLKGWSDILQVHAITPHQSFAYTTGKNASDIALVIDAMDLMHSGRFDGFCLVSSDSDFTRLASRIREQGLDVYGFGEEKTPASFRQACTRFIYTENLLPATPKPCEPEKPDARPVTRQPLSAAVPLIRTAIAQLEDATGWVRLGSVGQRLAALQPDFDSRTYGSAKLVDLVEKTEAFEVRRRDQHVDIRQRPPVTRKTSATAAKAEAPTGGSTSTAPSRATGRGSSDADVNKAASSPLLKPVPIFPPEPPAGPLPRSRSPR